MANLRTRAEVLQEFEQRGLSLSAWARREGVSAQLVYQILSGKKRGLRGQSHEIAVKLGLKDGVVGGLDDLPFAHK